MTCGHAEDAFVSWLFFRAWEPFPTGIAALQNLAHGLLLQYEEETCRFERKPKRECCRAFQNRKQEGDLFCPVCGASLGHRRFNLDDWYGWLRDRHGATADDWGGEFEEPCGWWPWPTLQEILATPQEEILYIAEHGEIELAKALRGDELDNPTFRDTISELWEGIQANVSEWDRKQDWNGTQACFARRLDTVAPATFPYRLGPA